MQLKLSGSTQCHQQGRTQKKVNKAKQLRYYKASQRQSKERTQSMINRYVYINKKRKMEQLLQLFQQQKAKKIQSNRRRHQLNIKERQQFKGQRNKELQFLQQQHLLRLNSARQRVQRRKLDIRQSIIQQASHNREKKKQFCRNSLKRKQKNLIQNKRKAQMIKATQEKARKSLHDWKQQRLSETEAQWHIMVREAKSNSARESIRNRKISQLLFQQKQLLKREGSQLGAVLSLPEMREQQIF